MKSIARFDSIIEHIDALITIAILDKDIKRLIDLNTVKILQLRAYVDFLKGLQVTKNEKAF